MNASLANRHETWSGTRSSSNNEALCPSQGTKKTTHRFLHDVQDLSEHGLDVRWHWRTGGCDALGGVEEAHGGHWTVEDGGKRERWKERR